MIASRDTAEKVHSIMDLVDQSGVHVGCIAGGSTATFFRVRTKRLKFKSNILIWEIWG